MEDTFIQGSYSKGLLVILGAGASYDCVENGDVSLAPPLTNQLAKSSQFTGEILSKYELAQPVIGALRHALRIDSDSTGSSQAKTLEEALAEYRDGADGDPLIGRQLTAFRFYLRDLLYKSAVRAHQQHDGINNYTRLVHECVRWARKTGEIVCFVSFNFDPLLEWACQLEMSFRASSLSDYVKGERIFLLKPHGSVLWSWEDDSLPIDSFVDEPYREIIAAGEPKVGSTLRLRASAEPYDAFLESETRLPYGAYPAMALPMAGEKSFVWPEEQSHLFTERFQNGAFGKVLTVGWRGNEKHFVDLMPTRIGNTAVFWTVTGKEPGDKEEIMRNLSTLIRQSTGRVQIDSGFSRFVNSDLFDNFLAS